MFGRIISLAGKEIRLAGCVCFARRGTVFGPAAISPAGEEVWLVNGVGFARRVLGVGAIAVPPTGEEFACVAGSAAVPLAGEEYFARRSIREQSDFGRVHVGVV
jgi:hypothetical protein